ncbi:MAG: hypothetical protein HOP19_10675 [Acidobacteria bacterium]|nr:hypothetical protein [Acidobacteriota bacterium]
MAKARLGDSVCFVLFPGRRRQRQAALLSFLSSTTQLKPPEAPSRFKPTGGFMPDANFAVPPKRSPKELYDEALLLLDKIVPQVLHRYWLGYTADDVNRFTGRITLLLLMDDHAKLRDLKDPTKLEPWLRSVIKNEVLDTRKQESRDDRLDDLPET